MIKGSDVMGLWGIFISAFLIGFSGAMMPGPMLGVTIDGSLRKGYTAGPLVVLGHGVLELTLVIVMASGLKGFFSNPMVSGVFGLFGGVFLAWMGYGMIKSSINKTVALESQDARNRGDRNLVLAGALVSATNPYFILWWASTGMESIRQSYAFGLAGILMFFTGHIISDFTWYSAVSIAFSKGKRLISYSVYRWLILILGVFISCFALYFIISGWSMLLT